MTVSRGNSVHGHEMATKHIESLSLKQLNINGDRDLTIFALNRTAAKEILAHELKCLNHQIHYVLFDTLRMIQNHKLKPQVNASSSERNYITALKGQFTRTINIVKHIRVGGLKCYVSKR